MAMADTAPEVDKPEMAPKSSEDRLEAAARTLPRRRFVDDMPDRGLFAVALVGGFAAILLLKTMTDISSIVVMIGSVAAMLGYGVIAFRIPTVQMRPDRLGDNLYYLGFVYTLASLSAALVQLQLGSSVDQLLGNFGIALVTTVVGICGRVLFAQMRGEIDEIEARVRRDLAAVSADLRAQLILSLKEFETFHTSVLQATSEAMTKVAQESEANLKKMATAGSEQFATSIADSQRQAELLSNMLTRVNQAITELPLMTKLELPNERLERQIASLASEIGALVNQLEYVTGQLRNRLGTRRRRWYWLYLR